MTKCANCTNDADYTHVEQGISPVDYCATCLPEWLSTRAAAGHFPLVQASAPKAKEVKQETVTEEEPPESSE